MAKHPPSSSRLGQNLPRNLSLHVLFNLVLSICSVLLQRLFRTLFYLNRFSDGRGTLSEKWGLRTELIIAAVKVFLHPSKRPTISAMQETGSTPRPAKKPVWAVQTTCPVPNEHDVLRVFMEGAKALNRSTAEIKAPSLEPVDMEWVGHCTTKTKSAIKEVGISPEKQYQGLLQDTSASTIFHLHGGAFM